MRHRLLMIFIVLFSMPALAAGGAKGADPELSLKDLGFTEVETKPTPELQKVLEERRHYLRQHQIWGLVALVAMTGAVLSGGEGDLPPEHPFLAGLAVASYATAGYMAAMAPDLPHGKESGGSKWHRRLVWIHLPGMILTPILGYMAAKKIDRGEKLTGPEKYHKDVAMITAASLGVAALTVTFEF